MKYRAATIILLALFLSHPSHAVVPLPGQELLMEWNLATGNLSTDPVMPTYTHPALQPTGITSSGVNRLPPEFGIVATGWPNSSLPDPNRYFQFVIAAQPGYSVNVSHVWLPLFGPTFNDPPGPGTIAFRPSRDNYTANLNRYTSLYYYWTGYRGLEGFEQAGPVLPGDPLTLRFYPHDSPSPDAMFGFAPGTPLGSIRIFGTVPEPSALALLFLALLWRMLPLSTLARRRPSPARVQPPAPPSVSGHAPNV